MMYCFALLWSFISHPAHSRTHKHKQTNIFTQHFCLCTLITASSSISSSGYSRILLMQGLFLPQDVFTCFPFGFVALFLCGREEDGESSAATAEQWNEDNEVFKYTTNLTRFIICEYKFTPSWVKFRNVSLTAGRQKCSIASLFLQQFSLVC